MNTTEFRKQLKTLGLAAKKRKNLEVLDITINGSILCTIYYTELHEVDDATDILAKKRPKHIPDISYQ